jgi:hypothetical protein
MTFAPEYPQPIPDPTVAEYRRKPSVPVGSM